MEAAVNDLIEHQGQGRRLMSASLAWRAWDQVVANQRLMFSSAPG
jgi:hypothetical protein